MRQVFAIVVAAGAMLLVACREKQAPQKVLLLTTPAVAATNLPQELVATFQNQTGRPAEVRIVTREQIFNSAQSGSGAAALYRDAGLDARITGSRAAALRQVFAYEDYWIIGPSKDPAHVRTAPTAVEAFRRIVMHKRPFCSPVDQLPAHTVEHEIWSAAMLDPSTDHRYKPCRGEARQTLAAAAKLAAYTIADRGSVEANPGKGLAVLLRDVPMLHNSYVIVLLPAPDRTQNRDTTWFVEWLMSFRGREAVQNLRDPALPRLYPPDQH